MNDIYCLLRDGRASERESETRCVCVHKLCIDGASIAMLKRNLYSHQIKCICICIHNSIEFNDCYHCLNFYRIDFILNLLILSTFYACARCSRAVQMAYTALNTFDLHS